MPFPMTPPFTDFGNKPGQRTSAAFLDRMNEQMYSGRTGIAFPLTLQATPFGDVIGLDRETLDLHRMRLRGDLTSGGSADALFVYLNPQTFIYDAYGETITIHDAIGDQDGSVIAQTGDVVLVKWHPDSGRHEVVRSSVQQADSDWFPAELTARTLTSGVYLYGWRELEFATKAALPTVLSGGRTGDAASNRPAVELNNQIVAVGTFVWLKRGYRGERAVASISKTESGNNAGTFSAFSLFVRYATGGTFKITMNGGTTSALAFDATAATVKAAIETASGLTLSSFSGAGTFASPWTFSVTTNSGNYFASTDGRALDDDSGYAFAAPDGSVVEKAEWTWTSIQNADYTAAAGEAVPVDYSGGSVTITLPSNPAANDKVMIVKLGSGYNSTTNFVHVFAPSSGRINGYLSTVERLGYLAGTGGDTDEGEWTFTYSGDGSVVGWVSSRTLNGPQIS